jgi:hypothetical protein
VDECADVSVRRGGADGQRVHFVGTAGGAG